VNDLTFVQLRHALGFGVVRLKLLLAIRRLPELDHPGWRGQFRAEIGKDGQVKAGCLPWEPARPEIREVTFEGENHS
jgi:hypothetical protein